MSFDSAAALQAIFNETTAAHRRFAGQGLEAVLAAATAISRAVTTGRKVLAFGNGGGGREGGQLRGGLGGGVGGGRAGVGGGGPHAGVARLSRPPHPNPGGQGGFRPDWRMV